MDQNKGSHLLGILSNRKYLVKVKISFRYDDLVDYNGRDVIIVLPGQTTMYDIERLAVMDTIRGQVVDGIQNLGN